MDRRVLGSGAIVCSAMVLWSQPSAPGFDNDECEREFANSTSCPAENLARQTQEQPSPSSIPPETSNPPASLAWSRSADASNQLPDTIEKIYDTLLEQAQVAANQDQFAIALANVAGIPKNSQHHERAKQLQENWSQELLQRAIVRCQQGEVGRAKSMLNAIPPTSQQHARAIELQERWGEQAALLDRANAAQTKGDWHRVIDALESLEGTPLYHSLPVQELLQQAIYNSFRPSEGLMQLAAATPTLSTELPEATVASVPTSITTDPTSAPVAPLPASPDLPIDIAQAMEWAQPPAASVASTPPRPHRIAVARSQNASSASSDLPSVQRSIAPPESVAAIPFNKVEVSRSAPRTSENVSPETPEGKYYPE